MPELPKDLDPYRQTTAYDILGVDPKADATEIRNQHTRLKRNLQESGLNATERAKQGKVLEDAYNQIRVSASRVQVDFFFVDNEVGIQQCRKVAQSVGKPQTDVGSLIRPKRINVNHLALVDVLQEFYRQPDKVVGFHPQPTGLGDRVAIPEPLQVRFDC